MRNREPLLWRIEFAKVMTRECGCKSFIFKNQAQLPIPNLSLPFLQSIEPMFDGSFDLFFASLEVGGEGDN
jgi:hypothetical protein